MLILKKDFRKVTVIIPENADDLWALSKIIGPKDLVKARTIRTQAEHEEKKPVTLKIEVEKTGFDEECKALRLTGKIVEGPEDVEFGYHTLRIDPGTKFSVEKEWKQHEVRRLESAAKAKRLSVIVCVADEKRADFGMVTDRGIKEIATITNPSGGKQFSHPDTNKKYYSEILDFFELHRSEADKGILAGPGFTKDNAMEEASKRDGLSGFLSKETASVTGITGMNEVVKRGGIERVVRESQFARETLLVEKLLENIARDTGLAAYGKKEVLQAAEIGAVEILLVSEKLVREESTERLISVVESSRGEAHVISTEHEAGEKLLGLGGVAALLRFRMQ